MISQFKNNDVYSSSNKIIPVTKHNREMLDKHTWKIFISKEKQSAQGPFIKEVHFYVALEVEKYNFKYINRETFLGAGSQQSVQANQNNTVKKNSTKNLNGDLELPRDNQQGKWWFYMVDTEDNQPYTVVRTVFQKKLVHEMFAQLGYPTRGGAIFNPSACEALQSCCFILKPTYKMPEFRVEMERGKREFETLQWALFQMVYDMETNQTVTLDSLVQYSPEKHIDVLRVMFCHVYNFCEVPCEKKLPLAHLFIPTQFLSRKGYTTCKAYLCTDDQAKKAILKSAMEAINLHLDTWKVQTMYRRQDLLGEFVTENLVLPKPTYSYLSVQRVIEVITIREFMNQWIKQLPKQVLMQGFDEKKKQEYTDSVSQVVFGTQINVVCHKPVKGERLKLISNFKDLLPVIWYLSEYFPLVHCERLFQEENVFYHEMSEEAREKVLSTEIVLVYYHRNKS